MYTHSNLFSTYFRSYNEFLDDLDKINFDWFIKSSTSDLMIDRVDDMMELVKNKLSQNKASYKITRPEIFLKTFDNGNDRHCIINVIEQLTSYWIKSNG
jgi:hypothetical protein